VHESHELGSARGSRAGFGGLAETIFYSTTKNTNGFATVKAEKNCAKSPHLTPNALITGFDSRGLDEHTRIKKHPSQWTHR